MSYSKLVKIKNMEEIERIGNSNDEYEMPGEYEMPTEWNGARGGDPMWVPDMIKYCNTVISLKEFNGWIGYYGGFTWSLPMFDEVKLMNRNGANK